MEEVENLRFPQQKGGSVREEGEPLVDEVAWLAGIWTAGWVSLGSILAAPPDAGLWLWVVGLVITGLFGLASSATAVIIKFHLEEWREKRRAKKDRVRGQVDSASERR